MSDHITVIGNVAGEPERRQTSSGDAVASFRLATTQRHRDESSRQWVDGHTNWYTVSVFRGLAEHVLASLHKGQRVIVTGRLKLKTWETSAKKGMEAEIDADGLGHDLLWGTSTFQRDSSSLGRERPEPSFPASYPPAERDAPQIASVQEEDTRVLVAAGLVDDVAWDASPLGADARDGDTPF